jgi:hypothetical protein
MRWRFPSNSEVDGMDLAIESGLNQRLKKIDGAQSASVSLDPK